MNKDKKITEGLLAASEYKKSSTQECCVELFCIRPYFETVSGVWPNTVILGVSSFASQHRFAEKFV